MEAEDEIGGIVFFFFFLKQKTAYDISACLVGSEMCIRDRHPSQACQHGTGGGND